MAGVVLLAFVGLVFTSAADDTVAIQAKLDSGDSLVYLPPRKGGYLISKTLRIHSGQELRLDRFTRIRLAPKSDCPMIENANYLKGDRDIVIEGGIWDFDNAHQSPNPYIRPRGPRPETFSHNFFTGTLMRFAGITNFTVRGITYRNPTIFSVQMRDVSYFTVEDITFDFDSWNPIPLNMDGIHIDSGCHHGRITNLRGTCFDDMVAINANECWSWGPISDIDIDGIYADYCHSAVRLLSANSPVSRITIRNVHGNFYCYTVGLTHHFADRPKGRFDDIVIENVFASKALAPGELGEGGVAWRKGLAPVWVEGVDVGKLTISNWTRDESNAPAPFLKVEKGASVENLAVRDCRMVNRLQEAVAFLSVDGSVGSAVIDNVSFEEKPGKWARRSLNPDER